MLEVSFLSSVNIFYTSCQHLVFAHSQCVHLLEVVCLGVCTVALWPRQLLLVSRSLAADSLCGLPKWWRAAQPLLPPKLQGTKTTNKSKSGRGAGVGGGGVGLVCSLGGRTPPALPPLTKSACPGAAKSASAGPQGAPRHWPWRW